MELRPIGGQPGSQNACDLTKTVNKSADGPYNIGIQHR